jgi:hypothetical protein
VAEDASASYPSGDLQILDRNGQSPRDYECGWNDTLRLDSGDDVRVIMRLNGYRDVI